MKRQLIWLGLICLLPICMLIVFVSFLIYGEIVASSMLSRQFDELRQAGLPYDNDSLAVYFEKQTYNEGTAAWSEVLELCKAVDASTDSSELPLLGAGGISYKLVPGSERKDESRVAEFLQEVQPLIKRIQAADVFPKPVRMPIEFNGYNTTLGTADTARRASQILELDSVYALYREESGRALIDITAIHSVKEAFDWRFCAATIMIETWIANNHCTAINRSLRMNLWNDDQLATLASQVKTPIPVRERWREMLTCQRALASASQSKSQTLGINPVSVTTIPAMPSTRLFELRDYDALMSCADQGVDRFWQNVERRKGSRRDYQVLVFFDPKEEGGNFSQPAINLIQAEDLRRMTYAAISVKRFQRKNNRWPSSLAELSEFGLLSEDWSATDGSLLGYRTIENGVTLQLYPVDPAKIPPGTEIVESEAESLSDGVVVR